MADITDYVISFGMFSTFQLGGKHLKNLLFLTYSPSGKILSLPVSSEMKYNLVHILLISSKK